ncbi:MAG: hypothetical protein HOB26_04780 [Flavobacteriales bacterium]|jgi:hypothetical protein|nr:hypothetical protein [Flavobacteriales bacterium]
MKTIKITILSILALSILICTSCKRKGCTNELATNYESKAKKDDGTCEYSDAGVIVTLDHKVGADDLVFTNKFYYSAAGHEYSIETIKYVLSRVTVNSSVGDVEVFRNIYVDAEDENTLTQTSTVEVPAGDYTGITFTFGLNESDNIASVFTSSPETNMVWPDAMGGGYHFMKLEGFYDSLNTNSTLQAYNTHIGSIDGMGMAQENSWEITLNESFTVAGAHHVEFHIEMDIQEWFETPNTYDFSSWNNGTMMEMVAQTQLKENGQAGVFILEEVAMRQD